MFTGPDVGTGAFGDAILMVYETEPSGLLTRVVCFAEDDLEGATRELDERFAALNAVEPNRCAAVFGRVLRAFESRDWDALIALYADDFFVVDARQGMANEAMGRDGSLEGWQAVADVGGTRARDRVLGTRGETHALTLVTFLSDDDSPDAFATDVVFLNELDAERTHRRGAAAGRG